jgi:hypothetical protein
MDDGLTATEYGLLKYAYLKAELSAKPDETIEQTKARANEIWKQELQKQREQEKVFINAVMSLPEKYRKSLLRKMRKTGFSSGIKNCSREGRWVIR